MSALNRIIIIGEMVETPDIKVTSTGDPLASFRLAVKRPNRVEGAAPQMDYIKVVAWRQVAELAQPIQKGMLTLVEGQIHTRSYDTEAGIRKYVTEVEARNIQRLTENEASFSNAGIQPLKQVKQEIKTERASVSHGVASPIEVLETATQTSPSPAFDFEESHTQTSASQNSMNELPGKMPPDFDQELEEDIPF